MWTFRVTKLNHEPVAEVHNAYERKYTANLSKPSTASFSVRKDNPILSHLFEDESKLLQVWQDNSLVFWGPIISSNFAMGEGAPPSIAVSAADVSWRLTRRLAGKSEKGTAFSGDKLIIAREVIAQANAEWTTEIAGTSDTCGSTGNYTAGPYKESLACINELAHGLDGFDWYIEPRLNEVGVLGRFRGAAVVGSEKPLAVFEYGTGRRNMRSMGFLRDISTELNVAWNISDNGLEPSAENPTPVVLGFDTPSIESRGRFEEVVELSGVNNVSLRQAWVEENVRVRKDPRRVLSMTSDVDDSAGRVPQFRTDYWLGDTVPVRAVVENNLLFNGQARVFSVQVVLNDAGTAMVTPILVDEGE